MTSKLVPEEIFSSIATIYKDLMAMGCANTANKLLAVGVQLEALQSPAHDGEVVYLIYHGDGECAVDEVSKADYDEHEGPKRILYTAPPRVAVDIECIAKGLAESNGWDDWDTAKDVTDTPAGNEPEEEREWYRDMVKFVVSALEQSK